MMMASVAKASKRLDRIPRHHLAKYHVAVRSMFAGGMDSCEIAEELGISEAHVCRLRHEQTKALHECRELRRKEGQTNGGR